MDRGVWILSRRDRLVEGEKDSHFKLQDRTRSDRVKCLRMVSRSELEALSQEAKPGVWCAKLGSCNRNPRPDFTEFYFDTVLGTWSPSGQREADLGVRRRGASARA